MSETVLLTESTSAQPVAPVAVAVFNATPLDVQLWANGSRVSDLPALERFTDEWATPPVLEVRSLDPIVPPLAVLQPSSEQPQWTLHSGTFASRVGPPFTPSAFVPRPIQVAFTNAAGFAVDGFYVDPEGNERQIAHALRPDEELVVDGVVWGLYLARATFTGELLAMFVFGPHPVQSVRFTITDSDLKKRDASFPLPSPLPEIPKVTLVETLRERPQPRSRDYIVTSESANLQRARFNTRSNVVTRSVRIAGVKLVWDSVDDRCGLMSYQGSDVLDLAGLDMYADHVVIASPLRFPGTRVTIHAAVLEFRDDGRIDTTPIPFTAAARSGYLTDDGGPAGSDGKPTYQAAHRADGEPAGDIGLFVGKLVLPEGGESTTRFIARGSDGQRAEPGGLRPYKQTGTDRPAAGDGKDLPVVTNEMI